MSFKRLCGKPVSNTPLEVPVSDVTAHFKAFFNRPSSCPTIPSNFLADFETLSESGYERLQAPLCIEELLAVVIGMNIQSAPGQFGLDIPTLKFLLLHEKVGTLVV